MTEVRETRLRAETPTQKFIGGMKGYLERGSARISMVLGLEQRNENLAGIEGVRFLAGINQMAEELITKEYLDKDKDFPGAQKAIEELTGKRVDDKVLEATDEALEPWMKEFEQLKPTIGRAIQLSGDSADAYPLERITARNIRFALNLLIASQSEQVTMRPKNMREQLQALASSLKSVRNGLREEQRWRETGWNQKGLKSWKGVTVAVTGVILTIACAAGALFGTSSVITSQKFQEWLGNFPKLVERAPGGIGDAATEKARTDRYKTYYQRVEKNIKTNEHWPSRVGADNLLDYLDPVSGYNDYKAIIEFCGPQCLLDPAWAPGEGKQAIMDFLGVDEAGYKYLQEHPDQIDEQLRTTYPDKPWLWELFGITPTPLNGEGESDFEKWQDKNQSRLGPTPFSGLGQVRIANDIHTFRRNQFLGQRAGFMNRGRGFGTPKGV